MGRTRIVRSAPQRPFGTALAATRTCAMGTPTASCSRSTASGNCSCRSRTSKPTSHTTHPSAPDSASSTFYPSHCSAHFVESHAARRAHCIHRNTRIIRIKVRQRTLRAICASPLGAEKLIALTWLCCCSTVFVLSVCTILDAIDVNAQRMREALKVDSEVTIARAMKKAHDQRAHIDAFEQATNEQIDDEFQRLEERLRARKQILLQDVAHKSEVRFIDKALLSEKPQGKLNLIVSHCGRLPCFCVCSAQLLRSHVSSSLSELSHLRERLVLGREVLGCLLGLGGLRSHAGLVHGSEALSELEELQSQLGAYHRADKPLLRGHYQSTFKPVMKELLSLGVVPDVTSSSSLSSSSFSSSSSSASASPSSSPSPSSVAEQGSVGYENHSLIGWQSRILQSAQQVQQLQGMFGGVGPAGLQVELLYRASRDGFSAEAFHAHTDKRGQTLLLVRARETAKVFGALSVCDYESCDSGGWMIDPTGQSCIFSLANSSSSSSQSQGRPFKLQCVDHDRALFVRTASGPMIGGRDICMGGSAAPAPGPGASFDAPNSNSCTPSGAYESRKIFQPESHRVTHEIKYDSSSLAGSPSWSAAEVEVFAVKPFGLLELLRYSRILRMLDLPHLARFFAGADGAGTLPHSPRLLYRASEHGYAPADFRARCTGRGATLTFVKVAGSNYCWGAYMAVEWPAVPQGEFFVPALDPQAKSFMFSLVNAHGRPLKLKIKTSAGPLAAVAGARRAAAGADLAAGPAAAALSAVLPPPPYALYGHSSHGPVFGGSARLSPDVILGVRDDSSVDGRTLALGMDHEQGNSINTPTSYAIDEELEAQAGLPGLAHSVPPIVHDRRLLAGGQSAREI